MKTNLSDHITLENYLLGRLTDAEMYQFERQAQEDPFLYEALEGFELSSNPAANLSMLQKQLQERIAQKAHQKKVFGLTWQRLSIAAAAAVTFITAGILFWMNAFSPQGEEKLASQSGKEVHVTLPDRSTGPAPAADSAIADQAQLAAASPAESSEVIQQQNAATRKAAESNRLATAVQAASARQAAAKQANAQLEEVTVTAYGTQRKEAAASVARIDPSRPQADSQVNTALAGKVSGIVISNQNLIRGKVLSSDDNLPLPGVSVKVKGKDTGVTTNAQGEFSIPADDKATLQLGFIGYDTKTVDARAGDNLTVTLDASTQQLNEVVTVGYGKQRVRSANAAPAAGMEQFQEYLKTSVRKPSSAPLVKGNVRVGFTVNADGSLSGFRIIRGLTDACNAEAIRVIKEGPEWLPASNGKAQQRTVDVPFK